MDLETKCPHCDQWTVSDIESCSKCGGLLFESKEGANPFISSLKKNWKLATGLAVAVLILSVLFFRPNPTPPPEKQALNLPPEKPEPSVEKPDLSEQLGFYGQWDKDKDGYLDGTEIVAAMTELSKVDVNASDISGESGVVKFRWEPPRDIDLDQRLSREELTQQNRGYFLFQEYDLDKDGLLSKAEIEKEPVADIAGVRRKQLLFEPLKKFDLNQDGKLALLEIPPYHSYFGSGWRMGISRAKSRGRNRTRTFTTEQRAAFRKRMSERNIPGRDIPGLNEVNDAIQLYFKQTGQAASSIGNLINAGITLPAPPLGTQWSIDPATGTAIITPL